MGLFQNHMMAAAASAATTTYTIDNSCRFNDDDSTYMTRTPGSTGNVDIMTQSTWIKRANITDALMSAGGVGWDNGTNNGGLLFGADNKLNAYVYYTGSSWAGHLETTAVFRDVGSWYNFVLAVDTTQGVAANRIKLWINGEQVTALDTANYPDQNQDTLFNAQNIHMVGWQSSSYPFHFDGYIADLNYIDGTAYTASDFGETNDDGVWVPKNTSGLTFGTNGFHLDFKSSGDLGNDVSGNSNDLTTSGLVAADQMTDTPTDNFCTINSLIPDVAGQNTANLSEGNLKIVATTSSVTYRNPGTFLLNSGKWYWEGKVIGTGGGSDYSMLGIYSSNTALGTATVGGGAALANEWLLRDNGDAQHDGGGSSTGLGDFEVNDIIQIALDMDAKKMWFGRQNTFDGDPAAGSGESFASIDTNIVPLSIGYGGGSGQGNWLMNFGQSSFAYTPPTGFNAVSTANLATPTITDPSEYYQTGPEYAGNDSTQTITFDGNADMQPDIVWIKATDGGTKDHVLTNSVRGTGYNTVVNLTLAEDAATDVVTAFNSDGFSLGDGSELAKGSVNGSSINYVSWNWKESATAGMDIVTWTGNATNRTISHSLGVVPNLMIVRGTSARDWMVYHSEMSSAPETDYLRLDTSGAIADEATIWNDTAPTSSVFSVGTGNGVNANTETYVGYLFANVEGFSKFGGYTGNGNADGPVVYCGFRPSLVIIRNTSVGNWNMYDTTRNPYNVANRYLYADADSSEGTSSHDIDILSNGFKPRNTSGNTNDSGNILIYIAFAENPFGGDGVAPATAR